MLESSNQSSLKSGKRGRNKKWRWLARSVALLTWLAWAAFFKKVSTLATESCPQARNLSRNKDYDRLSVSFATSIRGDEWNIERKRRIISHTLSSLQRLVDSARIFVFVDGPEMCQWFPPNYASVQCVDASHCKNTKYNLASVACLIRTFVSVASTEYVVFMNADIVIFNSFMDSLALVISHYYDENFLMIGQRRRARRDISRDERFEYLECESLSWKLEGGYALDYFAFRRDDRIHHKMPPMLIGNWRWDSVLATMYYAENVSVIDATETTPVWHQKPYEQWINHTSRPGSAYNSDIATKFMQEDLLFGSTNAASKFLHFSKDTTGIEIKESTGAMLLDCAWREGSLWALIRDYGIKDPNNLFTHIRHAPVQLMQRLNMNISCTNKLRYLLQQPEMELSEY